MSLSNNNNTSTTMSNVPCICIFLLNLRYFAGSSVAVAKDTHSHSTARLDAFLIDLQLIDLQLIDVQLIDDRMSCVWWLLSEKTRQVKRCLRLSKQWACSCRLWCRAPRWTCSYPPTQNVWGISWTYTQSLGLSLVVSSQAPTLIVATSYFYLTRRGAVCQGSWQVVHPHCSTQRHQLLGLLNKVEPCYIGYCWCQWWLWSLAVMKGKAPTVDKFFNILLCMDMLLIYSKSATQAQWSNLWFLMTNI